MKLSVVLGSGVVASRCIPRSTRKLVDMRVKRLFVGTLVGVMALQAVAYAAIPDGAGSSAKGGSAAVTKFETTVKDFQYDKKKGKFSGKVTSGLEIDPRNDVVNECVEGREVKLYRKYTVVKYKKKKKITQSVVERVGSDKTDVDGSFQMDKDKKSGKYHVEVEEAEFAFWDYYGSTVDAAELVIRCLATSEKL